MQDKYIQSLRYKLQKRVRRVNSANHTQFYPLLKLLFQFIDSMPLLAAVRDELLARTESMDISDTVDRIIQGETLSGETEAESAAIGYTLLKRFAADPDSASLINIAHQWGTGIDYEESFDFARNVFLEPFYEYVDEHIDDQQAILYFLRHYKHRCEWFLSDKLRQSVEQNTGRGEALVAADLYAYLHDQGIEFFIEPNSASGIADFVAEQVGDERVIADAKLFWPEKSKGKAYIVSGFNQVYTYARDYNEPCGYLVIFKMCKEDLNFLVPPSESLFPCLSVNNKTIFFIVIDLCEHGASASKRGALKSIDVKEAELVQSVEDSTNDKPNADDSSQ